MGAGVCTKADAWMVNTWDSGTQTAPVAVVVDGQAVIAWHSNGQDGNNLGVYFATYDETGEPVLPETRANLFTTGAQQNPSVAPLGGEAFFIGWESNGQDGSGLGVFGRMFLTDGSAAAEVGMSASAIGNQEHISLATLSNDGLAVVWLDATDGGTISGSTISSSGLSTPWNEKVFEVGNSAFGGLASTELENGSLAVVFESKDGFDWDLSGKILESQNNIQWSILSSLQLPDDDNALETHPAVVVSGNNVFIAYLEEDPTKTSACVVAYDSEFKNPKEKQCVAPISDGVLAVSVSPSSEGEAILAWQDSGVPDQIVSAARISSDGVIGLVSTIDTSEMDPDGAVSVTGFPDGKAVVVWTRSGVATGLDVWAQFVEVD